MMKELLYPLTRGLGAAALLLSLNTQSFGTPSTDECSQGNGCIALSVGGSGAFNYTASFDLATLSQSGQLSYTDSSLAPGGLTLNSSTLIDFAVLGPNSRAFDFILTGGGPYTEARVYITDNGATGDTFQIQLLDAVQNVVYDTLAQPLSAACGGGITLGTCVVPSPCQLEVTAGCALVNQSSSSDSCTVTGNSAQVQFFYTIKNAGSTAVSLGSLTASDSFGGLDLSSLGGGSLAPGQQVTLSVTETVTGPFPFVNTVTVSGGSAQCSDMASVTINQQTPPPPQEDCDDFVTGGGWIIVAKCGAKANFGVHGGIRNGSFWGGLNFLDHSSGMHVKSTGVTGYTVTGDVCRQINFTVSIDGTPGTAVVNVCDNGEPGRNDTFSIQLSNGYKASGDLGGNRPGGGNIQLHKPHCGKDKGDKGDKGNNGKGGKDDNGKGKDSDNNFKCSHQVKCKTKAECDAKTKSGKK